jgi:hypothetical protein
MLMFCLLICWTGTVAADGVLEFSDTKGYWAEETIVRISALGLVSGYSDRTFKPRDEVSLQETVVMLVNTLGKKEEAGKLDWDNLGLPPLDIGSWAKGSIALGVKDGWISLTDLVDMPFREPATRLNVAMFIARALNLDIDNTQLTFTDSGQIPLSYYHYVAAVIREGIMQGVPGNRFEPMRAVTRAEMAALMTKMLDLGLADPCPGRGFVAELLSSDTNKVNLKTVAGERTYNFSSYYLVYRNNQKGSLFSLFAGENVRVVLDSDHKVIFLAYTSDNIAGAPPKSGHLDEDEEKDKKDEEKGNDEDIYRKAYVVNKYWDHFTVRYDNDTHAEVFFSASTRYYQGNRLADYKDFSRGARVELVRSGSKVVEVRVLDEPYKVFGEVISVNSDDITIEDADGYSANFDLADRVTVRDADGIRLDMDDVKKGDWVELRLNDDDLVDAVTLDTRQGDEEGVVVQIRTTHTPRITIEDDRGREDTYFIIDKVLVTRDKKTLDLKDIEEGDKVRLWLDRYDDVLEIEVLGREADREYRGIVTKLDLSDDLITVQRGIRTMEYDLGRNVQVRRDGASIYLDEVIIGAEVELTIVDDTVIAIEVIEDQNTWIEGEIIRIDDDREQLTIEQSNGSVFRFDFADDAYLRDYDGSSIRIRDLHTYEDVEIELRDGKIYRLYVL